MLCLSPAPPSRRWEPGLLCCPALARLADGHPRLPGSLRPQQLATRAAAERGLPNCSTARQPHRRAGRNLLPLAARLPGCRAQTPGSPGPRLWCPGGVLSSWDHQDPHACLAGSCTAGWQRVLGAPSVKSHLWHSVPGGSWLSPCSPCHRGRDAAVLFQRSPPGREHGEGVWEALRLCAKLPMGALSPPELSHHRGWEHGPRIHPLVA